LSKLSLQPKTDIIFPFEIGWFLNNELNLIYPKNVDGAIELNDLYDSYDLNRLMLSLWDAIKNKNGEDINKNEKEIYELLSQTWDEADKLIKNKYVDLVVSLLIALIGEGIPIYKGKNILKTLGWETFDDKIREIFLEKGQTIFNQTIPDIFTERPLSQSTRMLKIKIDKKEVCKENMVELYRIKADGEILEVKRAPFSDEPKELEDFIMKNEGILGNVALLNRQIALPDGKRIDLWGLDTLDLRPVIIELKNILSGIEIIPQILPYYNFVKLNPDTLKLRALSDKNFMGKLESLEVDSEKLSKGLEGDPKVILMAPSFSKELSDVVDYIKFDIELIEISRYKTQEEEFLVTINKPLITTKPPATVRVMEEWNWEKYQKEGISDKKIEVAKRLKQNLDEIISREKIELTPIFRKLYIPYQIGRNNVFWFDLMYTSWTTGDVLLTFYLEKEPDMKEEGIEIDHTRTKWMDKYNQWSIFFKKEVDLSPLIPIIIRSYEYVTI